VKYVLLALLVSACVRNAAFEHDNKEDKHRLRLGDCVMVIDGYYEGCEGTVRNHVGLKTQVVFYGYCRRAGIKLIDNKHLVLITKKGGY